MIKDFGDGFRNLLKSKSFVFPITLTAIASFIYFLVHFSVSVDDLSIDRYLGGESFAQGRFGGTFLKYFLNLTQTLPFLTDFLSLLITILAAVTMCLLFKKVSCGKIKPIVYTVFSCIFISYPLVCEIANYWGAWLDVSVGYLLVAFSVLMMFYYLEKRKISYCVYSSLLLMYVASSYESLLAVYILLVFASFIVRFIYDDKCERKFKRIIEDGLKFLFPLLVGIILKSVISKVIMAVLNLEKSTNAANQIAEGYKQYGLVIAIKELIVGFVDKYLINALWYLPIALLVIALAIAFFQMIFYAAKSKKILVIFLYIGLVFSLGIMSLIAGKVTPYRASQVFAVFVAFVFALLLQSILESESKKWFKNSMVVLSFLVIFYQTNCLNRLFTVENMRYEQEAQMVHDIVIEIKDNFDTSKPVIFVGDNEPSDIVKDNIYIRKDDPKYKALIKLMGGTDSRTYKILCPETSPKPKDEVYWKLYTEKCIQPYLKWGKEAFMESNTEIYKYIKYHGLEVVEQHDYNLMKEFNLQAYKNNMPAWPQKGSILENENYILVRLG